MSKKQNEQMNNLFEDFIVHDFIDIFTYLQDVRAFYNSFFFFQRAIISNSKNTFQNNLNKKCLRYCITLSFGT